MKFRLAQAADFKAYGIDPASVPTETESPQLAEHRSEDAPEAATWHDTIPVPAFSNAPVFIVMNFDADEQVGKFVYHCDVLEHEDPGLMAPMEVYR